MTEKFIKARIRKLARGDNNLWTIKKALELTTTDFDEFIKAELKKKVARQESAAPYAGRNIRYQ